MNIRRKQASQVKSNQKTKDINQLTSLIMYSLLFSLNVLYHSLAKMKMEKCLERMTTWYKRTERPKSD